MEGERFRVRRLWELDDGQQLVRVAGARPRVLDDIRKAGIAFSWDDPQEVAA
jgi:hypothetical protein